MAAEFEFQDLSDASFWGVDLQRAAFRDVDFSGARAFGVRLVDVEIDAEIDRLVVNGVDVTAYVNEHDPWFELRSRIRPTDAATMAADWDVFVSAWDAAIERAAALPEERRHESVDAEWSFVQTLRHLVMAIDKWFTAPVLGGAFQPIGLPNTGSLDVPFPGIDLASDPPFDEAVAVWRDRGAQLRDYLAGVDQDALTERVDVLENGPHAVHDCVGVVFEEHFQHLRYARRDLDRLG